MATNITKITIGDETRNISLNSDTIGNGLRADLDGKVENERYRINGLVSGVTIATVGVVASIGTIYFDTSGNYFVLYQNGSYYRAWTGGAASGAANQTEWENRLATAGTHYYTIESDGTSREWISDGTTLCELKDATARASIATNKTTINNHTTTLSNHTGRIVALETAVKDLGTFSSVSNGLAAAAQAAIAEDPNIRIITFENTGVSPSQTVNILQNRYGGITTQIIFAEGVNRTSYIRTIQTGDSYVAGGLQPLHFYTQIALEDGKLVGYTTSDTQSAWKKRVEICDLTGLFSCFEDFNSYGVEFDVTVSSPTCTRIGNAELHKKLPIQSRMRGCLLDDDGNVVEYLNPTDWTQNVLDGTRGQVMVEIPTHYRKFETDGNKRRVRLSEVPLAGYHEVPKSYVSSYQATVERSTSKLASVKNTSADYRGGNNNAEWDGTYKTLCGMPATSISRTNFRKYARNRKADSTEWNCMTYDIQKTLFWLFVTEYATLNSQTAFNSELTAEGYRQGGLGAGVTTMSSWADYNNYYPLIPCGVTDSLGNATGTVAHTIANDDESIKVEFDVPRYHGIENPFGHLFQWTDGINVRISADEANGGDGLSKAYICSDPDMFNDSNYDGYEYVGNIVRTNGSIKHIIFGEGGEILPLSVGSSTTTYFCDNHYTSIPTAEALRGFLFGGYANYGAYAGFACSRSPNAPSSAITDFCSRLCFLPR